MTPCVGPPAASAVVAPVLGGAGGLPCRLRGMPNRNPSSAPTAKAPPETIHACPLSASAVHRTLGVFGSRSAVASVQMLTVPTVIASHQSSVRTTAWRLCVVVGSPSDDGEDLKQHGRLAESRAVGRASGARGETPTAVDGRCIPPLGVARRSNIPDILPPRAWIGGRLGRLRASRAFHHGLLDYEAERRTTPVRTKRRTRRRNSPAPRASLPLRGSDTSRIAAPARKLRKFGVVT